MPKTKLKGSRLAACLDGLVVDGSIFKPHKHPLTAAHVTGKVGCLP